MVYIGISRTIFSKSATKESTGFNSKKHPLKVKIPALFTPSYKTFKHGDYKQSKENYFLKSKCHFKASLESSVSPDSFMSKWLHKLS